MLILNTGGTFNKRYNPIMGELDVPFDNRAVDTVLEAMKTELECAGVVYKDSLEMDLDDRKMIARIINESDEKCFVIVHGTDTMGESAAFLDEVIEGKVIVFTGAMVPFSIDPVEATANLSMAIGFAKVCEDNGVYICMHGLCEEHSAIRKNRELGKFELVKDSL